MRDMNDYEHTEAHTHGECGLACPMCQLDELNRLTEVHHNETIANPETYFTAPDQLHRPALWQIVGDDVENPVLVVRRDEFRNEEAWGLLVVGVRVAQAVAAPTLVAE